MCSRRCTLRSQSLSDRGATYMALSCDFEIARIYCLPSPCARLSRARTTTKTLPLVGDIAGLGSLPEFVSGAPIEVPLFMIGTLGAVGGRLCPWQRGLCPIGWWAQSALP